MPQQNILIIGMGSNHNATANLEMARQELKKRYPQTVFSNVRDTEPVGFKRNTALFTNQLALLKTEDDIPAVRSFLKSLEQLAQRTVADKANEIVRLDLDILQANETIIKKEELQRSYYQDALSELPRF